MLFLLHTPVSHTFFQGHTFLRGLRQRPCCALLRSTQCLRVSSHSACVCSFFSGLSIASLILYFVTSSDSGSLVIDCLTSNGNPAPPVFQRIFWSCTEGAVAMALLFVGGKDSLTALRAVSIVAGALPT